MWSETSGIKSSFVAVSTFQVVPTLGVDGQGRRVSSTVYLCRGLPGWIACYTWVSLGQETPNLGDIFRGVTEMQDVLWL